MKRKKRVSGFNMGNAQGTLMNDVAPVVVGWLVGDILTKQLTFLQTGNTGNFVKLAGGVLLAGMGNGIFTRMGVGLAAQGAVNLVEPALQSTGLAGMGLLPPGAPSRLIAGIETTDGDKVTF